MYSAVSAAVESQRIQICPCFPCREQPRQPPRVLKLRSTNDTGISISACQETVNYSSHLKSLLFKWHQWKMSQVIGWTNSNQRHRVEAKLCFWKCYFSTLFRDDQSFLKDCYHGTMGGTEMIQLFNCRIFINKKFSLLSCVLLNDEFI